MEDESSPPEIKRGPGRPPKIEAAPAPVASVPPVAPVVKRFPVRLNRGYFPKDPEHPKHPLTDDPLKVERGEIIALPIDEAKDLIKRGLAERADDLPL